MTFGDFIKIMNNAGVFRCKRDEIAAALLDAAGIYLADDKEINTRVTKWIDRKVPDKICSYFKDGKVNEDKIKKYFSRWTKDNWQELQKKFLPEKDGCIVDCVTNDREVFYQSLVNQFIKSLGFPLQEKSGINRSPSSEQILGFQKSPFLPNKEVVLQSEIKSAQLHIPEEYERCLFCIKWHGSVDHANEIPTGVYGKCIMYDNNTLSISEACRDFEPHYTRITSHMLRRTWRGLFSRTGFRGYATKKR